MSNDAKLTDPGDIKKYVMAVIRSGNKKKIHAVLKRYSEWMRERNLAKNTPEDPQTEDYWKK